MIVTMLISGVLSVALCALMIPVAFRTGLVDHPGARKVHETVTPLAGGPALFVVFLLTMAYLGLDSRFVQGLAIGGTLVFGVGLVDDLREVPATVRFAVQIAACLVMVYLADLRLLDFGRLFWDDVLELGPLNAFITVFAAMGVINAFNLIDGMDGLAGTIFIVAAAGMAWFAGHGAQLQMVLLLGSLIAAVAGFLLWNARWPWNPRGRLFLGDSGSVLLGFVLAWSFIALGNDQPYLARRAFMPITAVWLIAVPLLDTSTLIWKRWREGRSAFSADQHHLHHAFLRAGFTVGQTWLAMTGLALAGAAIGVAFEFAGAPDYLSFWTFLALAFAYYFYMRRSWNQQRFLGRHFIYNERDVEPSEL
jgi:UDP-GlcNAc:undecaprenyl-phosphate GlcNAc-1-phosphate transferase